MEPNQIKDADFLDILFEGRNKEYGAYELRKTYNRRIVKALFVTGSVIGLLFIGGYVAGFGKGKKVAPPEVEDVVLDKGGGAGEAIAAATCYQGAAAAGGDAAVYAAEDCEGGCQAG